MVRYHVGTSKLADEAGFGVRVWSHIGYVVAKYYRRIIAFFVITILYFALGPYVPPMLAAAALGAYVLYFCLRHLLSSRDEQRFYHQGPQLIRAHLSILGILGVQALLQLFGAQTSVWILYLLPLAMISRHSTTTVYALVTAEICAVMIGIRFFNGSPVWMNHGSVMFDPDLIVQCLGLSLAAFIMHYLMRNIDARDDHIRSLEAIEALSDPMSPETDAPKRWQNVLGTYLEILNGMCGSVWLCDHNTRKLKLLPESVVGCTEMGCFVQPPSAQAVEIDLASDEPIARAARVPEPLFCEGATCPLSPSVGRIHAGATQNSAALSPHSESSFPSWTRIPRCREAWVSFVSILTGMQPLAGT
jgi:hypothetical protein